MTDPVTEALEVAAATPWNIATNNDAFWLCDYVKAVTGTDPAEKYRGEFTTKFGAGRMLRRAGGLLELFSKIADQSGFERTDTPSRGDIGLVGASAVRHGKVVTVPVCALCLNAERWAIFVGGLAIVNQSHMEAWKI